MKRSYFGFTIYALCRTAALQSRGPGFHLLILVCWWVNERQFDGGAEVEEEGDDLVDRAGLEFGQTVVVGGARGLFDVVLDGEHHWLEQDAQRADHENDGGEPAVFAEEAVKQRLQRADGVCDGDGGSIGCGCGKGREEEERGHGASVRSPHRLDCGSR